MNVPNKLTVLRLIMVPVFFIAFSLPGWFGEGARTISIILMLLCYITAELSDFLDGKIENEDVLCSLTITENMQSNKIDFVRYLSILSQYKAAEENAWSVLKYYSSYASRENFYVDYVSFIIKI